MLSPAASISQFKPKSLAFASIINSPAWGKSGGRSAQKVCSGNPGARMALGIPLGPRPPAAPMILMIVSPCAGPLNHTAQPSRKTPRNAAVYTCNASVLPPICTIALAASSGPPVRRTVGAARTCVTRLLPQVRRSNYRLPPTFVNLPCAGVAVNHFCRKENEL